MTAIWLLSTKGRPKEAQETIDACMDTGMTSPGVVYCDETPYPELRLPKNWRVHHEPRWRSLQGSMSWCFRSYPDASAYGWLADDTRPRTERWDKLLEEAAGDWNLVCARDLWFSEIDGERDLLESAQNLSSGLCWGGMLVRAVGWWATPGLRQGGIDTAWLDIVRPFGLHRYVHDVTVEHLNWRTKKRAKDAVDDWAREGVDYIERDFVAKNMWFASADYRDILRRVADKSGRGDHPAMVSAVRRSFADDRYTSGGGIPGARLTKILEGMADDEIERFDANQRPARMDNDGGSVGAESDVSGLGAHSS